MLRNCQILIFLIIVNSFLLPVFTQVVVINEVCTSPNQGPAGTSVNANSLYNTASLEQPPENREWIELYNPHPCDTVDISCYTLASNMYQPDYAGGGTPNWGAFTFPAGTKIPPLKFLVIGGNNAQVPVLDFDLNYYRQNFFGINYLDGDETRWFLRDEYGWIALYSPSGTPVDAIYWDAYGDAANLYSQEEYSHSIVTTTACSGTQTLAPARNIAGIEFVGMCMPGTNVSFQRILDGGAVWHNSPISTTPHQCNGPCVGPPVVTATVENESCAGNDGSIALNIQDGHTGPYTINWLNPAGLHGNTIGNLQAGTYLVQVADAYNCFIVYDTINLSAEPDPAVNFTSLINETCNKNNGSLQTAVSDGNLPINYLWNITGTGNTATIGNLSAGTYSVTITDNLGCTASNSAILVNFPGPELIIDSVGNEMCSASDGAIFLNVNGGSIPFSYTWNTALSQNAPQLTGLPAGNYSVTITDANSCSASATAVITNTPPPAATITGIEADTCRKKTGAATIIASGGNPPYAYHWSADSTLQANQITNLSEGTYFVAVSDIFCTTSLPFTIPLIPGPTADFSIYPAVVTIDDPPLRFVNLSTGIIDQYIWDFGDKRYSYEVNPYYKYSDTGHYEVKLTVKSYSGCIDSIVKEAVVMDRITLFVPNCFSPNDDGVNDYFIIGGQHITEYELFIYNRWGELVYQTNDLSQSWDGRYQGNIVPEGIYGWIINYSEDWSGIYTTSQCRRGMVNVIR